MNVSTNTSQALRFSEPRGSIYFRLSLFTVVIVSSLVGNFVVAKAYHHQPHLKKPLTYVLVTNLAIAEFAGTLCLPFIQVYDEMMSWPFGDTMCRLINAFMLISFFVIPWSLAAIAFVRCKAFLSGKPLKLSARVKGFVLAAIWVSGVLISAPTFLFAKKVKSIYDNHSYWCIELFPGDTLETFPSPPLTNYYFVRFIINFAVPGIIIVIGYGGVAVKLKRHLTSRKSCICSPSITQMTSVTELDPESPSQDVPVTINHGRGAVIKLSPCSAATKPDDSHDMENNLLRMLYVVVAVYMACYFPYQVIFLMEYFWQEPWMKSKYYVIARKYVYLLTCLPSAIHPLCYGTMSKFYTQAFTAIICKKTKNTFSPHVVYRPNT